VVAFKAAIQEPLSIDARTSLAVENQVHAILAAASVHLAGADGPGGDKAGLLAINQILASEGLLLHLEVSTADGLPVIESVSVSGFEPDKGGALDTKVFESLLGPTPYPDISVFQATEETVFSRRDGQHRPSPDMLVAPTAFALEDWSNAADAAALTGERRPFVPTLFP
jgi:hypothetical protein